MDSPSPVLVLSRSDIAGLMRCSDYLDAVESGFRALRQGRAELPPPMSIDVPAGAFHAKAAGLRLDRRFVALKFNGNFPGNPTRTGLPTIQGAILLCDGANGAVLAIMDSIEVTLRRTAAATAVAARYLARPSSASILICGCGEQGSAQLAALCEVLPIERGLVWDKEIARAEAFAARESRPALALRAATDLHQAARSSDVIVTCTTATEPFLNPGMVSAGTFVAAVGADHPRKNEIAPDLMAKALVVTDSTAQCAHGGDLHHAIAANVMAATDVHAEVGELVAGIRPGRSDDRQITLFDSTGLAIQDVASAARIYSRALCERRGTSFPLGR